MIDGISAMALPMTELTTTSEAEDLDLPVCLPSQLDASEIDIDVLMRMTQPQRARLIKKIQYLKGLAQRGVTKDGLMAAGTNYTTISNWRANDPWFARMEVEATLEAKDNLEAEAYRRAVQGVDEPVVFQGMITTVFDPVTGLDKALTVKKYSDSLLQMLLKASDPEKYRENAKVDVQHGGAVGVLVVPGTADPTEWARIAAEQQARFAHNTGTGSSKPVLEHKP